LTSGDQSGLTSAPRWPHIVQTIFGPSALTAVSSGMRSAFMVALWLQLIEPQ
jgi:hypothetical protein